MIQLRAYLSVHHGHNYLYFDCLWKLIVLVTAANIVFRFYMVQASNGVQQTS